MEIELNKQVQERLKALFQEKARIESLINDTVQMVAMVHNVESGMELTLSKELDKITVKDSNL